MASKNIQLESRQAFSRSMIWEAQRSYYDSSGIDAWTGDVPCYITTNPFIAHHYASTVAAFITDWLQQNPDHQSKPFYCVEIGAGHGQFGFYFLKQIQQIFATHGIEKPPICYVMTDFTASNIEFWQQHKALQPFIEQGLLDFAQFDLEKGETLELIHQQKTIRRGDIYHPVIVFANYLFDSIVTDVFYVNGDQIEESVLSLSTPSNNLLNDQPKSWEKVDFEFNNIPIEGDYYPQEDFNAILNGYRRFNDGTYVQFPVGSLRGLENLKKLSNNKMLLLSSDKGYVTLEEMNELEPPELAFHGSFSLMVNFHALGEYCKLQGGDYRLPYAIDGFASGVFLMGVTLDDLPSMRLLHQSQVATFGPAEFFCFYEHMEPILEKQPLKTIIAYLSLSRWDPYIYEQVSERINELIDDADDDLVQYVTEHLPKVAEQFYYLPDNNDLLFDLAVFYHEAELYPQAVELYQQSLMFFDPTYAVHFNLAYSLYHCDRKDEALSHFEIALTFDPKDKDAKHWLSTIKNEAVLP